MIQISASNNPYKVDMPLSIPNKINGEKAKNEI